MASTAAPARFTPYESLLLFQFLSTVQSPPSSFISIADHLRSNAFVQQDASFDRGRLTAEALEELYNETIKEEANEQQHSGDGNGTAHTADDSLDRARFPALVSKLVTRLYDQYKGHARREIEQLESKYVQLRKEAIVLEEEETQRRQLTASAAQHLPSEPDQPSLPPTDENIPERVIPEQESWQVVDRSVAATSAHADTSQEDVSKQVPEQSAQTSPAPSPEHVDITPDAQLPSATEPLTPSTQTQPQPTQPDTTLSTTITPHATPTSYVPNLPPQPQIRPAIQPSTSEVNSLVPTTTEAPETYTAPAPITHGGIPQLPAPGPEVLREASLDSHIVQPPPTTPTQPPPSKPSPSHSSHVIAQPAVPTVIQPNPPATQETTVESTSTSEQFVSQADDVQTQAQFIHPPEPQRQPLQVPVIQQPATIVPRVSAPPQSPTLPPITRAPLPSPIQLPPRHSSLPVHGAPSQQRTPRTVTRTPSLHTPWKPSISLNTPITPGSPPRPRSEDVSPISEKGDPFDQREDVHASRMNADSAVTSETEMNAAISAVNRRGKKRGRPLKDSDPSSPRVSTRSSRAVSVQSRMSHDEESATDGGSVATTNTRRTSTRRKPEVASINTAVNADDTEPEVRSSARLRYNEDAGPRPAKRRRGVSNVQEEDRALAVRESATPAVMTQRLDPGLVQCTRNFGRTCATIMDEVAAHKFASIFAKPLTERDAPGYRDLIYLPQDIKSIKSAIHSGNRAVAMSCELPENIEINGDNTPKNSGLIMKKTPDLVPPKGIVNSSQLEMELVRMFANAIMFNPTSEQTFGDSFVMVNEKDSPNGSYRAHDQDDDSDDGSDIDTKAEAEEGGIIDDTVEMYEDIERAVARWRAAERAVDDNFSVLNNAAISFLRKTSTDVNSESGNDGSK